MRCSKHNYNKLKQFLKETDIEGYKILETKESEGVQQRGIFWYFKSKKHEFFNSSNVNSKQDEEVNLVKLSNEKYNEDLFIPIKSETGLDLILSFEKGIMPGTNLIFIGDPGIGKSTLLLDYISGIKIINPDKKVLFISAEMNKIDLYQYVKRFPTIGEIDILFPGEYEAPYNAVKNTLEMGWDIVLIDSFSECIDTFKIESNKSKNVLEKELLDLLIMNNEGQNLQEKNTSFLIIQQVSKGGNFIGSNKLKHNTTGMAELRYDKEGKSYLFFSKNRRGLAYEKLYFTIGSDSIIYNIERYTRDKEIKEKIENNKRLFEEESYEFDKLFNLDEEENYESSYEIVEETV